MAELDIRTINGAAKADPQMLVDQSVMEYDKIIDDIARKITGDKNIKIILLAGPSGSGKTTSANLLSDKIKSHGEQCMVVSLDDFYRDFSDPEYPRLENGERDFEACEALDIPCLVMTLIAIANNKSFVLPKFDFKKSVRARQTKYPPLTGGCVIIEGLHALNPLIFTQLPKEKCFKIFISVSTNVNDGEERILSGRKIRFVRRMVRDSIYRNADAQRTLDLWKNVLDGEDKYLYPNRVYADLSFNTFHPFELSVMRRFVENLISSDLASKEPYAKTVLDAVKHIEPIDLSLVPDDSLIREFIPGGIYENLY